MNFSFESLEPLANQVIQALFAFAPKLAGAIAVLIFGWIAIGILMRGIRRVFDRTSFDEALESFIISLASIGLKLILLVMVAAMLGVQTSSLVALLGAAGLAIGLALQGSLSNFAGGVLILIFKPFKIGDYIEAQGYGGTVREIQIFNTVLTTAQNQTIVLPNGNLSNDAIKNYTAKKYVRVDMTFGIGYADDIDKARKILEKIIKDEPIILTNHETQIWVSELGASSVDFVVRVFAKPDDSWTLPFKMNEAVKKAFDKEGISIPFPQRDVHHFYPEGTPSEKTD